MSYFSEQYIAACDARTTDDDWYDRTEGVDTRPVMFTTTTMQPGTRITVIRTNEQGTVVKVTKIAYVGTIVDVEMDDGSDRTYSRSELVEAE